MKFFFLVGFSKATKHKAGAKHAQEERPGHQKITKPLKTLSLIFAYYLVSRALVSE
jgi:hypothetical protein